MRTLTKSGIKELNKKYRSILRKCAILNLLVFGVISGAQSSEISPANLEPLFSVSYDEFVKQLEDPEYVFSGTLDHLNDPYLSKSAYTIQRATQEDHTFSIQLPGSTEIHYFKITSRTAPQIISENYFYADFLQKTSNTFAFDKDQKFVIGDFIGNSGVHFGAFENQKKLDTLIGTFIGNRTTEFSGGAINSVNGAQISSIKADFINNYSDHWGGAIYNEGGIGTIQGIFLNNSANYDGGAIYNENKGTITNILDSYFVGNLARGGGAIHNSGTITNLDAYFIDNQVIKGNADAFGGAIYNEGSIEKLSGKYEQNSVLVDQSNKAYGGAIYNKNNITELEATFTENHADIGGAVVNAGGINTIESDFMGNTATLNGGAIYNEGQINEITGVFQDNTASQEYIDHAYGGGAIYNGNTITSISGIFTGNQAGWGGAILNNANEGTARIDSISDSVFQSNSAATLGGAITNASNGRIVLQNTKFIDNNSGHSGGAISNAGAYISDSTANRGVITFKGVNEFIGNQASDHGGAIDNSGELVFEGKTIFSNNRANGVLNDIDNFRSGIINITGQVVLDGGILGNGSINFNDGSELTSTLGVTQITAGKDQIAFGNDQTVNKITINLLSDKALQEGEHEFISFVDPDYQTVAGQIQNVENAIIKNDLYNMTLKEDGHVNVAFKSAQEIGENIPVSTQEANTIHAFLATESHSSEKVNKIVDKMVSTIQHSENKSSAIQGVKDVAPTTSQAIIGVAKGVNSLLRNITSNRMSQMGRAGGDAFIGGSAWIQGLYNYTKQDSSSDNEGFTGKTKGVSFGIDGKVTENLILGIGYAYTDTNVDSGHREMDVEGHNVFLYSEYKPNNWFVNGMLNYGLGQYEESKTPFGIGLKSKYDVNTYAANIMTGYDFENGMTPEFGLRYLLADQESYNDGIQNITTDKMNLLTGVLGTKYTDTFTAKDWMIKPSLNMAMTYDIISDNSKSNVDVIGGGHYQITGEHLERLGIEAGMGLEALYNDWTLSVNYHGAFKKDFQSHTGMLKAKYHF